MEVNCIMFLVLRLLAEHLKMNKAERLHSFTLLFKWNKDLIPSRNMNVVLPVLSVQCKFCYTPISTVKRFPLFLCYLPISPC